MLPPSPSDDHREHERASEAPRPVPARCARHPERPASATCARCGRGACVPCTEVRATGETLCADCDEKEAPVLPWERRRELGVARALGRTIAGVLLQPGAFFRQRSRERALWPTLLLGLALHVIGALGTLPVSLARAERLRAELASDPLARQLPWLASDESFAMQAIASPLVFFLWTFLSAALWWIALRATGGLRRPFHLIVRALSYLEVLSLLAPGIAALGLLGPAGEALAPVYAIWAVSLQVVAVGRMQGLDAGRTLLAFAVWLALAGCLACVALGGLGWWLATQIHVPNV